MTTPTAMPDEARRRVLVVDDDRDFADSLISTLGLQGFATAAAYDFDDACSVADRFDPEVALLDIRLGRHNGLDLITILKRDRPDLVCIAVSAYSDFDYAIEAFRLGAADYLPKPVHPAHVETLLNNCFERISLERQKDRAEAQLRQAQKMEAVGQLAGGIAHDFNNILQIIAGFTQLAHDHADPGGPTRDHLDKVMRSVERARDLVAQILTFSRRGPTRRERLDLAAAVADAMAMLRPTLPATIAMAQRLPTSPTVAVADGGQIQQILVNLCTNAAQAIGDQPGEISVALTPVTLDQTLDATETELAAGPYAKLVVTDSGPGMDRATRERAIEPFFSTKPVGEGSGLGLSVVHGIVTGHGGGITIESEPGEGTRISAYFPQAIGAVAEPRPEAETPRTTGEEHILLVDDETEVARTGRLLLEKGGYRVTTAGSGAEAVAVFRDRPAAFDLVVTDQTMPEMTGAVLADTLLVLRPDIPIVLCTGYSHGIDEDGAKARGIRAFMMKPLLGSELLATVRRVLDEA